jgi:signal transduction histidine kinase/PAS domain-containing protein
MKKKSGTHHDLSALRLRAEERLQKKEENNSVVCSSPEEMRRLVHELSVHQIELEMQLEDVLESRDETLSASETSHRNIIDYMRNGYVYNRVVYEEGRAIDFVYEEVNAGYERMTGLKNVIGRKISEVFPGVEKSHPEFLAKTLRVAETGVPDRFEIYLEPLKKWFDISVYCPKKGYFVTIIDDITERKYYEFIMRFRFRILQMAESSSVEKLLLTTLDEAQRLTQSTIGFVFFVADDQLSLSLQACSTETGKTVCRRKNREEYAPLDLSGPWADAIREQRAVIHNYGSVLKHCMWMPGGCHAEIRHELIVPIIRNDRIVAMIGIGNKPEVYDERDVRWVTVIANLTWDIVAKKVEETERKKLQNQLQQAQKMEMVGQLAAGMAHEINNPLNFIAINFANIREITSDLQVILKEYQTITRKLEEGTISSLELQWLRKKEVELRIEMLMDDIPEIIVESQRGFERITAIINSMGNLSHRYATDKKVPFDINQGIIDTLVVTRHEYTLCADVTTTLGELPLVPCNPEQINQVILNLIINSVHAIQSQQRSSNGKISIHSWFDSSNVYCSIADDGPGIPEAIRKDIFNPFFTTKSPGKGTGLGLSISWDIIVNMHKGTLSFNTPAEGGMVFTLSLPRTTIDG